jgi:hypothetical protein
MYDLSSSQLEEVGGGMNQVEYSTVVTIGLMALAPTSVAVITVGMVALAFYGAATYYGYTGGRKQIR